jgi:hypothetical protein
MGLLAVTPWGARTHATSTLSPTHPRTYAPTYPRTLPPIYARAPHAHAHTCARAFKSCKCVQWIECTFRVHTAVFTRPLCVCARACVRVYVFSGCVRGSGMGWVGLGGGWGDRLGRLFTCIYHSMSPLCVCVFVYIVITLN